MRGRPAWAALAALLFGFDAGKADGQDARLSPAEIETRVEALFEKWNWTDAPGCALGWGGRA